MGRKLKIYFQALDGCVGHLNSCQGLAQALAARGHEVVFMLHPNQKGRMEKEGFAEIVLEQEEQAQDAKAESGHTHDHGHKNHGHSHNHGHGHNVNPSGAAAAESHKLGAFSDQSPIEKLKAQMAHFSENTHLQNNFRSAVAFNGQIAATIVRNRPDLIVLDNFLISPAIQASGIPWIYLFSPNPLGLYFSEKLPPFGAGFPTSSDPATWTEYKAVQLQLAEKAFATFQTKLNEACHFTPTAAQNPYDPSKTFFPKSPYLNIYGYPKELDYDDIAPMPTKTIRVDAFARSETSNQTFSLPENFKALPGDKLIFFSLGSQASSNVPLMKRILSVLEKTKYKFIVSKGPKADEYDLPANCWGEGYLPQPLILPLVDLVITHGGNNTVTETFSAGKPMIVLPISGDHLDNAQRIAEKGYGLKLDTHQFKDEQLLEAIEKGLYDETIRSKVAAAYKRIVEEKSKEVACQRIEDLVQKGDN